MPDVETIRVKCPNLSCQCVLAVPGFARGKMVRCRSCGARIRIPKPKTADGTPAAGKEDAAGADAA